MDSFWKTVSKKLGLNQKERKKSDERTQDSFKGCSSRRLVEGDALERKLAITKRYQDRPPAWANHATIQQLDGKRERYLSGNMVPSF